MDNIIFISIKNISTFYDSMEKVYITILSKYYNIVIYNIDTKYIDSHFMLNIIKNLSYNYEMKLLKSNIENIIKDNKNSIFFFTPVIYYFLLCLCNFYNIANDNKDNNTENNKDNIKDFIYNDFLNLRYINVWGEVIKENMNIAGYDFNDNILTLKYFKNAILNIISVYNNIKILNNFNIHNNVYFPIIDSNINKNIKNNDIKSIDILIYGNISTEYQYRLNIIDKMKKYFKNYNILFLSCTYDEELDKYLVNTKIVLHIPSFEKLDHMPWAKIMSLINKKIFFIFEENKEFYNQTLLRDYIFYKKDFSNIGLIKKYIENDYLRNQIIEKNYNNLKKIKIDSFINTCFKLNHTYVFLLYEELIYSSQIFYNNMNLKIIEIMKKYNINYIIEYDILKFNNNYRDNKYILIIDCSIIINLNYKKNSSINNNKFSIENNYIFIIGENYDKKINSFMGWDYLGINFKNDINSIILNAIHVTYQNDIIKDILINLGKKNNSFFCIDGYNNEKLTINENKKIDILYYGTVLYYERRYELIFLLLNTKNKMTIIENIFNIDYIINDSKVIIHCNSVENCYHVPYAKIIKPLINNNIIYCEEAIEIKNNIIKNYIDTFKYIENINNYINIDTNTINTMIDNIFYKNIIYDYISTKNNNKNINFIINSSSTYFLLLMIVYFKKNFDFKSFIFSNHFEIQNEYLERSTIIINVTEDNNNYFINANFSEILKLKSLKKLEVSNFLIESKDNEFLNNVDYIVSNYEKYKNNITTLNPHEYIKNNLNFEKNVLEMINYPISPLL